MEPSKNKMRVFTVFVLAFFILGILFLVWTTIQKDTSITGSSADVKNVSCGNIDTNNNGTLDAVDYNELNALMGDNCIDVPAQTYCGPKDTNRDSKIDVKDLSAFAERYNKPNCGLSQ